MIFSFLLEKYLKLLKFYFENKNGQMFKKNKQTLHCQDLFIIPIKWFFRTKIQLILHHKNEYLAIKLLHFRCIFILMQQGSVLKQQNSRQNITTDSAINSDQGHWIKMYLMEKPAWCCIVHCTKMHLFLNMFKRQVFSLLLLFIKRT